MNIKINSVRFDADPKLEEFINQKVGKLDQFFENIISAEVFLRVEKPQQNDNKVSEIKLELPGNQLFAKKQADTFEEATDATVEALRRQLKKHKEIIQKK